MSEGILIAVFSCSECHNEYEQLDRTKIGNFNQECPHSGKTCYAHLDHVFRMRDKK